MSALNTFGAIMTQAIELETALGAYYERASNSSLVAACAKRRSRMTRIRREAVLEITLEAIEGLDSDDYALELDDVSVAGQRRAAETATRFYTEVAPGYQCASGEARSGTRCRGTRQSAGRSRKMSRMVRGALVQATWTGDKESMIEKHVNYAREAAAQGAQVMCFQELFYGPYFCQVQDSKYYSYTESIPDGPTTRLMQDLAKETGMVLIVPMYEQEHTGVYYNTAAVIDADGRYLGKYRKTHIPQVAGFWEKFYFRPGNLGYPVFETAVGTIGVYICYDRHFPEGARALGLNGAEIVFIPSATSRGLSQHLWKIEQTSHAIANGYYVGTINRVGTEPLGDNDFYGQSYFCTPRGEFVGDVGDTCKEELLVRDLDMSVVEEVRQVWQFYRDRRPDAYEGLVSP